MAVHSVTSLLSLDAALHGRCSIESVGQKASYSMPAMERDYQRAYVIQRPRVLSECVCVCVCVFAGNQPPPPRSRGRSERSATPRVPAAATTRSRATWRVSGTYTHGRRLLPVLQYHMYHGTKMVKWYSSTTYKYSTIIWYVPVWYTCTCHGTIYGAYHGTIRKL